MTRGVKREVSVDTNLGTVDPQGERPDLINEVEPYRNVYGYNDKASMLAFMEEPVEIYLHEASNPNEEPAVFLSNNGEYALPHQPYLKRGNSYTIKRKFLTTLIGAQTTSYIQPLKTSSNPEEVNRMVGRRSMRYPFSVQKDTPEGAKWLQTQMTR